MTLESRGTYVAIHMSSKVIGYYLTVQQQHQPNWNFSCGVISPFAASKNDRVLPRWTRKHMSHLQMLSKCSESEMELCYIFEEDATFRCDPCDATRSVPFPWNILVLSANHANAVIVNQTISYTGSGCHAYVVFNPRKTLYYMLRKPLFDSIPHGSCIEKWAVPPALRVVSVLHSCVAQRGKESVHFW